MLSEAQKRVLQRLAGGDEIWTVGGRQNHAFWYGGITDRAPSFTTINILRKNKLIENYDYPVSGGSKYRITPAGRTALANEPEE